MLFGRSRNVQPIVPLVLVDHVKEPLELRGIGKEASDSFGRQSLLARRFVEAGVRFVEITSGRWNHLRLTFRYAGRDMRLTDVKGNVVEEIVG